MRMKVEISIEFLCDRFEKIIWNNMEIGWNGKKDDR